MLHLQNNSATYYTGLVLTGLFGIGICVVLYARVYGATAYAVGQRSNGGRTSDSFGPNLVALSSRVRCRTAELQGRNRPMRGRQRSVALLHCVFVWEGGHWETCLESN